MLHGSFVSMGCEVVGVRARVCHWLIKRYLVIFALYAFFSSRFEIGFGIASN